MDSRCREDELARFDGEAPVLSAVWGRDEFLRDSAVEPDRARAPI